MSDLLSDRYGTHRPVRRTLLVSAVVVLAVVSLGWLTWTTLFHARPPAQSELIAFDVVDEHAATARVAVVRRDTDVEAQCLLRAFAVDHSIVGELNFVVGPGGEETETLIERVRTERAATSIELVGCRADGQSQRR